MAEGVAHRRPFRYSFYMTTTTKTAARKYQAIKDFHASITFGSDKQVDIPNRDLANKIRRELGPIVKSAKWREAVEQYAQFVEDHPEATSWAYFQGSVFFAIQIS